MLFIEVSGFLTSITEKPKENRMSKTFKYALGALAAVACANTAAAGGLDRVVFSPNILFEKGNYVKLTFARTNPDVSPTAAPNASVATDFNSARFEYKHQFSDAFSAAFIFNNNPIGADIDYAALGTPLAGQVDATSASLLGKYNVNDNFSVYGGLKYQSVSATADLTAVGGAALAFASERELG
jgi:hypothetical protein